MIRTRQYPLVDITKLDSNNLKSFIKEINLSVKCYDACKANNTNDCKLYRQAHLFLRFAPIYIEDTSEINYSLFYKNLDWLVQVSTDDNSSVYHFSCGNIRGRILK